MTLPNIRQNLFFTFIYNTLGVPVAAAMSFSPVSVASNVLRLKRTEL